MSLVVDTQSGTPPFRQVVAEILDQVACGDLAPGTRLPSIRELALEALVNPNTVAKAYRELARMGISRSHAGRGVFVMTDGPRIARELRRAETLLRFERAAAEALRAGHPLGELCGALDEAARRCPVPVPAGNRS